MKPKRSGSKLVRARMFCAVALGVGAACTQAASGTFSDANWTPLGSGLGGSGPPRVNALALLGGEVYAGGGSFMLSGSSNVSFVAKWDGRSWSPLGSGPDYSVWSLLASGNNLYA